MKNCSMQRRHFELIAKVICHAAIDLDARNVMIEEFVRALKGTNGNFDADRFRLAATGWSK